MIYCFAKRLLDLAVAGTALLVLSPLLLAIAVALRLTTGSPVLFRHERPGYKGRPFTLLKFRTMNDARDSSGKLLPDPQRLTTFGSWVRRLSLDELPQLWNVLAGEMSLVGPRPLLMEFLPNYTPEQARRHDVKPGITGWAQVHGRHAILFSRRLQLDVWYVDHAGFWLDLKILVMTLWNVLTMRGSESFQEDAEVDDVGLHESVRQSRSGRQ